MEAVWNKASKDPGFTILTELLALNKKDTCGATIKRDACGKTDLDGWEIDHIKPVAKGGADDLANLQPLHWKNNRHKGDDWLM